MKSLSKLAVVSLVLLGSSAANADLIEQTIGDIDGFDQGIVVGQNINPNYLLTLVGEEGDTDTWLSDDIRFSFTVDLTGLLVNQLELEIGAGGPCTFYDANNPPRCQVRVYGDLGPGGYKIVGSLTQDHNNYAVSTFDITDLASAFDGYTEVVVNVYSGDGWAMDYATLRGRTTVPEPSTLALLAIGLAGIGLARRSK